MKLKLFLILVSICALPLHGMMHKLKLHHARSVRDRNGDEIKPEKLRFGIFCKIFPPEIDDKIIDSVATNCGEKSLIDACKGINSLAQINKFLNHYMNDDKRTLGWIKQLSEQFGVSDEDVACQIRTHRARIRVAIQKGLVAEFRSVLYDRYIKPSFETILPIADVNFTYGKDKLTPLMLCSNSPIDIARHVTPLLMEKNADITLQSASGTNAFMFVVCNYPYCREIISFYLQHHQMNESFLNQKNLNNDTALHYCFYSHPENNEVAVCVLLAKGIDPTIKNKDGLTALAFAKTYGHQSVIELLQKAELDFNSKKK